MAIVEVMFENVSQKYLRGLPSKAVRAQPNIMETPWKSLNFYNFCIPG